MLDGRTHLDQVASGVLSLVALGSFIAALAVLSIVIGG
jgi:hypothetical protein